MWRLIINKHYNNHSPWTDRERPYTNNIQLEATRYTAYTHD
jgi:hypothetical protein